MYKQSLGAKKEICNFTNFEKVLTKVIIPKTHRPSWCWLKLWGFFESHRSVAIGTGSTGAFGSASKVLKSAVADSAWPGPLPIRCGWSYGPQHFPLQGTVFCHFQSIRHDLELECWLLLEKIVSYYILYHIILYHISQYYSTRFNLCWPVWLEATQSWVAAAAAARAPEVGLEQSCWKCSHGKWNISIENCS